MQTYQIVILALLFIFLAHLTLKNYLSKYDNIVNQLPMHPARSEMLDFVTTHLDEIENAKPQYSPKGSNFYSKFHDSDLQDEKTDLSKYFVVEQSVPDTNALLNEINGGECGANAMSLKACMQFDEAKKIDFQTGAPMRFDIGSDGTKTVMPDQWSYKNENPMNGGKVDGVRAFDDALSDFALFCAQKPSPFPESYPYKNTFCS